MQTRRALYHTCRWSIAWGCISLLGVILPAPAAAQVQLGIAMESQPVISVSGPSGTFVEVQWSDSMTDPGRWFFLTNRELASQVLIVDSTAAGADSRFYRAVELPNTGMVLVPGGGFSMGDSFSEGFATERPVHDVPVSAFYMDRKEVTRFQWDSVISETAGLGYQFDDNAGGGKGGSHPVQMLSWYDAVKWCNARSEAEGRTPCYYTSPAQTNVYRSGRINLSNACVRWPANGYRLPTEAEWERAARGGQAGSRFPWGNAISHSNANYYATAAYSYDVGGTNKFHPDYDSDPFPYTSPVGSFPPNAYGIHDLVGNVWEWCWDAYDPDWYSNPNAATKDTRGPDSGITNRVMRGGSWIDDASQGRCANRLYTLFQAPTTANDSLGFRCVIGIAAVMPQAVLGDAAFLPGGAFRFTLYNLMPGKTNIIEASGNLTAWSGLATNVPSMATMNFTNTPGPGVQARFYRSRQLP